MAPKSIIKNIDEIVLGGNIDALEYAYHHGIPVFYDKLEIPFNDDRIESGTPKKDILSLYCFLLSISGLNYSSFNLTSFSVSENKIKAFGRVPWILEIACNKIHDLRKLNLKTNLFKVIDYIDVRSAGNHGIETIYTNEKFVNQIIFYPSQRMNASKKYTPETHDFEKIAKDMAVISYLTAEQLDNNEYSPVYSRIIAKQLMKEHGINGRIRKQLPDGRVQRHGISIDFNRREVLTIEENKRNYYYNNTKNKYMERLVNYLYGKRWRKNNNKYF